MREILFKAIRVDNKEWIEGLLTIMWGQYHIINPDYENTAYPIDSNTICQYTGLTDKNGNKIWENDVLFDEEYFVVRWDEEKAMFVVDMYGTKGCLMEYGFDEDAGGYGVVDTNGFDDFCSMSSFEVIGNIFDNPELLGV